MKARAHHVYTKKTQIAFDALRGLVIASALIYVGLLPLLNARRVFDWMSVPSTFNSLEGGGTFFYTAAMMFLFLAAMVVLAGKRLLYRFMTLSPLDAEDQKQLVRMLATNPPQVEVIRDAINAGVTMRYRDLFYVERCYAPEEALRAKQKLKEQVNKGSAA